MNQINTLTTKMNEQYDVLCAKEACTITQFDKYIQTFEECTEKLLATKIENSEQSLNLISESFLNDVKSKFELLSESYLETSLQEIKTISKSWMDTKLEDFKVACDDEIEEYVQNDLLLTIIGNKFEVHLKRKIQKVVTTDLCDTLTIQKYKDKVTAVIHQSTQSSVDDLTKESLKTLQDEFKMMISKLRDNTVSNIHSIIG